MILLPQKVAYRGSVSGLRISSVDGTAFIDNLPSAVTDLVAADPGNYLLEVYDATGKVLKGYLGAAGSGETVWSDLVTDGGFADPGAWTPTDGWEIAGGQCVKNGGNGYATKQSVALTSGALYAAAFTVDSITSGNSCAILSRVGVESVYIGLSGTTGAKSGYGTPTLSDSVGIATGVAASVFAVDDFSLKQVLTPASTGCTIVSTKGGATQSFATVQAGFAYNAAAYSVVVRKAR